uniref:TCM_029457 n=1 Tax=Catalpa bungei TaxID=265496 RepID=A0A142CD01_9LAMI|nr:TCM_029457 [Catalpa bungei]
MSTVEKLLVQILERKNAIIEQVKQQTELYNQHLASKLLIDGITPPTWLWNPNTSLGSKELNKEELISKLLCPYPQLSIRRSVSRYPVYNNLVVTGDNEEISDGSFMENLAFSNGLNRPDDPAVPALSSEDHAGCALNSVPEPDTSVTSPEGQTDVRFSNVYGAPDQSLAGIQRSKSRQKALELHHSAKAIAKSGLSHESIVDPCPSQIKFSLSAINQGGQNELPKMAEPSVIDGQGYGDGDLGEADYPCEEKVMDAYTGRITRSRSYAEVPIFARDSLTIGCSSHGRKDNSPSHVAKVRRKGSITVSDSEQADNYVNKFPKSAGPSTVRCQTCGERKVDGADYVSKDHEINVYGGRIPRSKISAERQSCVCDSSKADSSSDNYQRIDIAVMYSVDDIPPECVDGELLRTDPSNVLNKGCEARESTSEDCKNHRERGSVPPWSCSQQNACVDEVSDLDIPSRSAKAEGGIVAPSSGRLAQHVSDSKEVLGLVRPSVGLFRRVTRSQTRSNNKETYEPVDYNENTSFEGKMSKSDCKEKSAVNEGLQNTSSGQFIQPSYVIHGMLDEQGNAGFTMTSEVVIHNHVDQSVSSSSSDAKQRRELESQAAPSPTDSFVFVEPKQLNFNEIEERNLQAFISRSGKRRLVNSLEKMRSSLSVPVVSLDEGISGGIDLLSLHKQSQGMLDISSKGEETRRDCFEYDVQDSPDAEHEKFGPVISKYTMLKTSYDVTEAGLNYKISEAHHDTNILPSEMVDIPDVQTHQSKLHVEHGLESLPEWHVEEGNRSVEGKDKGQLMSNAPENDNLRHSPCYNSTEEPSAESHGCLIEKVGMTNPICVSLDNTKQFPAQESQILSHVEGEAHSQHADSSLGDNELVTCGTARSPRGEKLLLERRFRHASMESWPQLKRRKIEHQQSHSFTTSPRFRVRMPHSILKYPANSYLKNMEINVDTVLVDSFDVNMTSNVEILQEMDSDLTEGIESTFLSQNGELMQAGNKDKNLTSVINNEQLEAAIVSSLTKKEARDSQGCFVERMRTSNHFDAREPDDGQCSQHSCSLENRADNLNSENLILSKALLEGTQSPKWGSGSHTTHSVLSASNEELEFIDVDQSMPVFEGFIVDAQADADKLDFTADRIDLNRLNLPTTTIERASILAEICKSASLETPLSHFSSAFEFQETQNLFQSVPNVHLERLELGSTLPADVDQQLQSGSSLAEDYKDAFERMPYSDSLAYSGPRYSSSSRNQHVSPVGKLWERLSSHAGSSEKLLSSNPELTCFPIEEDPSVSEESKTADENADDVQEEIDSSSANHCDERQPLKDLTNLGLNPPVSVSAHGESLRAESVDSVSTKLSVTGTQDKVRCSRKTQYRDKIETRGKQTSSIGASDDRKHRTLSIGTNGIRKAKESINNSISKPILPNKTSLLRQDQKHSLKESRRNNIVSNVSSFIPLVQQKQAATVCAGKRDVKVKALEAAEAAKRLEEKKENERKMRKEALKLERAKLEEKNLREMEIEKKKKEEERKKKAADIIAKKRLREEEERKEKENKRMRLEARQRQWEQDEKMRAEKAGKEKQRSKDEQMKSKKEFLNGSTKQQNRETVTGDDVALKDTEAKWTATEIVMNHEKFGISGQSCEAGKEMCTVDKSPKNEDLIVQNSQGKSYEISPYQCSDDEDEEDEEDDELPAKKYIPSWASKSSVALLLPSQQKMDPDTIFPPESFCSMDEVLLPRKLRQNQVAE